ncbi:MAG: single-stranded DNA-binding protein [Clostridiales bacterium]|jgi:single-stranded DNA-binding protein|nr:single-stranded DNA-binding protein [Clostridiales bacterium]
MPQEGLLVNNSANIAGKIVSGFTYSHEVYGEGFFTFFVEVQRLSEASDVLPVTISERLLEGENFVEGLQVHITGQIRSYNNYVEADRKNKLVLTIFTKDIEQVYNLEEYNPNEIILNGFICKPPVYRTTPFGREIADLLLAVNRSYNKSDYIPCIAWGRNARYAGRLKIGERIRVYGRMQSRAYQKKKDDGQVLEKVAYEVSISKIETESSFSPESSDPTDFNDGLPHDEHDEEEAGIN